MREVIRNTVMAWPCTCCCPSIFVLKLCACVAFFVYLTKLTRSPVLSGIVSFVAGAIVLWLLPTLEDFGQEEENRQKKKMQSSRRQQGNKHRLAGGARRRPIVQR